MTVHKLYSQCIFHALKKLPSLHENLLLPPPQLGFPQAYTFCLESLQTLFLFF